ncbi:MAG TPA: glycoside hydrolase family 16 protein [Saprospiraceae bacterium]|nr:glycoside hydrolase family 16 protein [Saprospiraceae bacterium]HRV83325.1 glycoside hydrolase family 16 protein [Saprospiraceae bacterium]
MIGQFIKYSSRFVVSVCLLILLSTGCSETKSNPADKTESNARETLIWQDEFEGDQLDTAKWAYQYGAHGWGNNEWQDYTDTGTLTVANGMLAIHAVKTGPGQKTGDYHSARINSKQEFTYGRMEIRAKLPEHRGNGIWPAIWMLGNNIQSAGWPECGELDIMENVSYDPGRIHVSIHSKANNHVDGTQVTSGPVDVPDAELTFHNYGLIWNEDRIQFYLDDPGQILLSFDRPAVHNENNWPFDHPFYFILNIAVGGNWGGQKGVDDSIFPATMLIDYVRVYQNKTAI